MRARYTLNHWQRANQQPKDTHMPIDTTGVPSKVDALTGDSGDQIAAALTTPQPLSATFGGLAGRLLAGYTDPATVVVDPTARRVIGTSNPDKATELTTIDGPRIALVPDVNQTGRSLSFHVGSAQEGTDASANNTPTHAALVSGLNALVGATKPKFSVDSLIQALIRQMTADAGLPYGGKIVIDQSAGKVWLIPSNSSTEASEQSGQIAAIDPGSSDMVSITITGGNTDSGAPRRIFEGGATPTA